MAGNDRVQPVSAGEKEKPDTTSKRRPRWPMIVGAAFLGVVLFGIVGFFAGTTLENQDTFCIACHSVPETTYFNRAAAAAGSSPTAITDLATAHYHQMPAKGQTSSCISCHRGNSSLGDRALALGLGVRDTLVFLSGKADPNIEKTAIDQPALVNTACVVCHESTLLTVRGNATHFHNLLPQAEVLIAQGKQWISTGSFERRRENRTVQTSLTCTDCHMAHKTVDTSDPRLMFVDKAAAQAACDSCHKAADERPQSIDRLLSGRED